MRLDFSTPIRLTALLFAAVLTGAEGLAAQATLADSTAAVQEAIQAAPQEVVPDSLLAISPTGAFLRSLAVPGWGHAAIGSHRRGAFYVAAQGGTYWMLLRIRSRLASANQRLDLVTAETRDRLLSEGTPEDVIQEFIDADPAVTSASGLVAAREQQREDWLAFGIFLVLLGGADAFVSAHLQDFPAQPDFGVTEEGRVEVGLRVPFGN